MDLDKFVAKAKEQPDDGLAQYNAACAHIFAAEQIKSEDEPAPQGDDDLPALESAEDHFNESVIFLKAGAALEHAESMGLLARSLLDPSGKRGSAFDKEAGEKWLRKAASAGDARSSFELAKRMLAEGGPETPGPNDKEAFQLLQKAAEGGHRFAQVNLGVLFATGRGTDAKDPVQAVKWYREAATDDDDSDVESGSDANHAPGKAEACVNLGECYARGAGVEKSERQALGWFARATALGSNDGAYNLGQMYLEGSGTDRDVDRARKYLSQAAEADHPRALYSLGLLESTEHNAETAFTYFQRAAAAGLPAAMYNAGVCLAGGQGCDEDVDAAALLFQKAATAGHTDAMFNLGVFLVNGTGLEKDMDAARDWFVRAAELGNTDAVGVLEQHFGAKVTKL